MKDSVCAKSKRVYDTRSNEAGSSSQHCTATPSHHDTTYRSNTIIIKQAGTANAGLRVRGYGIR